MILTIVLPSIMLTKFINGGKKMKNRFNDEDFRTPAMCTEGTEAHDCVSVAMDENGVAVRSTNDPEKTTLFFDHNEWGNFVKAVRGGNFSSP